MSVCDSLSVIVCDNVCHCVLFLSFFAESVSVSQYFVLLLRVGVVCVSVCVTFSASQSVSYITVCVLVSVSMGLCKGMCFSVFE